MGIPVTRYAFLFKCINSIRAIMIPLFGNSLTYYAVIIEFDYRIEIKMDLSMLMMTHVAVVQWLQRLILSIS